MSNTFINQQEQQVPSTWDDFMASNSALFQPEQMAPLQQQHQQYSSAETSPILISIRPQQRPPWLMTMTVEVSGLSMEPLSGADILERCQASMDDVACRYLPCVEFLVQCQQELRKGHNSRKNSAHEFFVTYIQPLPLRFQCKNRNVVPEAAMQAAMEGLNALVRDAKAAQRHGSDAVKNHFLGGMKDGESWGLRKWLSRQGNALQICTTLECITTALRKLDKSADTTRKLADLLRPIAQLSLDKLRKDVPRSYQEQSSAHPYLPFFHRLEAALRSMSQFEPQKDDVICLDDSDDDDEVEIQIPTRLLVKRRKTNNATTQIVRLENRDEKPAAIVAKPVHAPVKQQQQQAYFSDSASSSGESDDESVIEIINVVPPPAQGRVSQPDQARTPPVMGVAQKAEALWPPPIVDEDAVSTLARAMATNLDRIAELFESGQHMAIRPATILRGTFWDGHRYAFALRLFSNILRQPVAIHFVERVNEDVFIQAGFPPFSHIIKHPISFRDIVSSLMWNVELTGNFPCGKDGQLTVQGLAKWNMWIGMDLLQAIDLVLLNSLAYGKHIELDKRTRFRSDTNKIRKLLWDEINRVIHIGCHGDDFRRKACTPTRRSEVSGFVVYKIPE